MAPASPPTAAGHSLGVRSGEEGPYDLVGSLGEEDGTRI